METKVQYIKDAWRSYGPPVFGAIIVLLVLSGGYYFLRNKQNLPTQIPAPSVINSVNEFSQDLSNTVDLRLSPTPTSNLDTNTPQSNLGGNTANTTSTTSTKNAEKGSTGTPATLPTETTPTKSTETTVDVLPKAGFPGFTYVTALIATLLTGIGLTKFKKK